MDGDVTTSETGDTRAPFCSAAAPTLARLLALAEVRVPAWAAAGRRACFTPLPLLLEADLLSALGFVPPKCLSITAPRS